MRSARLVNRTHPIQPWLLVAIGLVVVSAVPVVAFEVTTGTVPAKSIALLALLVVAVAAWHRHDRVRFLSDIDRPDIDRPDIRLTGTGSPPLHAGTSHGRNGRDLRLGVAGGAGTHSRRTRAAREHAREGRSQPPAARPGQQRNRPG